MPPAEFAAQGVYCTGDDCHKVAPKWERSISEVTPPKSSVPAVWSVEGFGSGKASSGRSAPIHFGDTQKPEEPSQADTEVPEAIAEASKVPPKPRSVKSTNAKSTNVKMAKKKSAKPPVVSGKSPARKARR